jgi:peptidoglycan hydrolase CwlO-like protein
VPKDPHVAAQPLAKMQTNLNDAKEKLEKGRKQCNEFKTEANKLKEEVAKNEANIEELSQIVNSYYNTIQKTRRT